MNKRINIVTQPMSRVPMRCKHCGGMTIGNQRMILYCPFCGYKEIVYESDTVKIQEIKSRTYKEIELKRQKSHLWVNIAELWGEKKKNDAVAKEFEAEAMNIRAEKNKTSCTEGCLYIVAIGFLIFLCIIHKSRFGVTGHLSVHYATN